MKWSRAVHHAAALAESCAGAATRPFGLRVVRLWAVGELLGEPRDLDVITVALAVDLPPDEVPWWTRPPGAQHWASAARLPQNPVRPWWRSAHVPVDNHRIVRPVLLWDVDGGVRDDALAALRDGAAEPFRAPAPPADELAARLRDELGVSLAALRARTAAYEERRWAPGRLDPLADALWEAADGYLDLLDAVDR